MDLKGTIVTADAMNCQKGTAATIINSKGDYVLALKGNQPLFYEEVKAYFDAEEKEKLKHKEGMTSGVSTAWVQPQELHCKRRISIRSSTSSSDSHTIRFLKYFA